MKTTRTSNRDAATFVAQRKPFVSHTKSLRGEVGRPSDSGKLPDRFLTGKFWHAQYVVYSYRTPIAYLHAGVWYVPNVRYSITTSHHHGNVMYGIRMSGLPVYELDPQNYRNTQRVPASTGAPSGYYGMTA